jgi:hypothetical protein
MNNSTSINAKIILNGLYENNNISKMIRNSNDCLPTLLLIGKEEIRLFSPYI